MRIAWFCVNFFAYTFGFSWLSFGCLCVWYLVKVFVGFALVFGYLVAWLLCFCCLLWCYRIVFVCWGSFLMVPIVWCF